MLRSVRSNGVRNVFGFLLVCGFVLAGMVQVGHIYASPADLPPSRNVVTAPRGQNPDATQIPFSQVAPTIDGTCDTEVEYGDGAFFNFFDAQQFQGMVVAKHDGKMLYVCMIGAPGSVKERFASVYLDRDNAAESVAEADDYSLRVGITTNDLSSFQGNGNPNGYQPNTRISAAERKRINDEQIEAFLTHGITPGASQGQPEKDITTEWVRID